MAELKRVYHGWVVRERAEKGYKDYFYAEWRNEKGERERAGYGEWRDPVRAIEFWDKKVGSPVKLEPTPLSAYRVYTEQ